MLKNNDVDNYFRDGFPLEQPAILLPWNTALDDLASASNAQWNNDRYFWPSCTFLNGLKYLLMSEAGIAKDAPFKRISALVGLDTESGLWSDKLSLKGFESVGSHLCSLFGNPTSPSAPEPLHDRSMSWECSQVDICLSIYEIHSLRCTLSISLKAKG